MTGKITLYHLSALNTVHNQIPVALSGLLKYNVRAFNVMKE